MKARGLIFLFPALFMIFFCGCRSACEIKNKAEGFNKEKLRVYVRADKSDLQGRDKNDSRKYMMILGERRAVKLLESYIITNSGDEQGNSFRLSKIPDVVKNADLVCEECNDDYCEAFIDYDAGALKDIIGK